MGSEEQQLGPSCVPLVQVFEPKNAKRENLQNVLCGDFSRNNVISKSERVARDGS